MLISPHSGNTFCRREILSRRWESINPLQYWDGFFLFIFIICRFSTAPETQMGMKIVQTPAIALLTSIDPS